MKLEHEALEMVSPSNIEKEVQPDGEKDAEPEIKEEG